MDLAKLKTRDEFWDYLKYQDPPGYTFQWAEGKENVWVADEKTGGYIHGFVKRRDPRNTTVEIVGSGQDKMVSTLDLMNMNNRTFDGRDDCSDLPHLSVASVMHNLRLRYSSHIIYTYSGLFLVAINPYKRFPIYTDQVADLYNNKRKDKVPPHVFASAEYAYRCLRLDNEDQSILITGESGAGKTENTKRVIQYLARVAGESHKVGLVAAGSLDDRLLQANPLLEALGNATTIKNDNSSRFGKFIKITFTQRDGLISGGSIVSYLLEKSRVVSRGPNERNFHIFYQMLSGMDVQKKATYGLTQAESYDYLYKSGKLLAKSVDDVKEFAGTMQALEVLQFNDEERETIFACVAAILHLGNVTFSGAEVGKIENAEIITDRVGSLLGVDGRALCEALIHPHIIAGAAKPGAKAEKIKRNFTAIQAAASRDALVKALYGRMFLWVVDKINQSLRVKPTHKFLGILDIAGFEIFKFNSFEQLCINFTNERLQQFFNMHMFELEQAEYQREGIIWKVENFGMDGRATIDLIGTRPKGILVLLDEDNNRGSEDDVALTRKITEMHKNHPKFLHNQLAGQLEFTLKHYAGDVSYDTNDWLQKNKDPLENDLEEVIRASRNKVLGNLFADFALGGRNKGAAFITIASQYRTQLDDLLKTLQKTHPHFIRCIIPNHDQTGDYLTDPIVLDQLRCNGVLEGIRISRMGYPNRQKFADFLKMYYLLGDNVLKKSADPKGSCQKIMDQLVKEGVVEHKDEKGQTNFQLGTSKIFFRVGVMGKIETAREAKLASLIPTVQAAVRGLLARRGFRATKAQTNAIVTIQRAVRQYIEWKNWPWFTLFQKIKKDIKRVDWDAALAQADSDKANATKELAKVQAERERIELQLKELEGTIGTFKSNLSAAEKQLHELQDKYHDTDEERNKLRNQMAAKEAELDELRGDMSAGDNKIRDLKRQCDEIEKELKDLEGDASKKKSEKNKQETEISGLTSALESERESNNKFQTQIRNLLRSLDEEREDMARREDEIAALARLKEKLTVELEDLLDEIDEYTKTKQQLDRNIGSLNDQLKDTKREFEAEAAARGASEGSNKKLQEKIGELKGALQRETSANAALDKGNKGLQGSISELSDTVEDENNKKKTLTNQLKKAGDDLADVKSAIDDQHNQKQRLANENARIEGAIDDLKRQLDETKGKIQKLEKEKQQLQKQLEDATAHYEEAENKFAQLTKTNLKLKSDLDDLADHREGDDAAFIKLKKVVSKLESDKKLKEKEYEDEKEARAKLEAQKKSAQAELEALKAALDAMGSNRSKEEKNRKDLEQRIRELEEASEEALSQKNNLEKKLHNIEDGLEDTQSQVDEVAEDVASLASARKKLEAELDALKSLLTTKVKDVNLLRKR